MFVFPDFGFSSGNFSHSQKPIAEYVPVIQSRPHISQYTTDYISNDPLNILDKPHRLKDNPGLFSNSSPASCHSPRHHGKWNTGFLYIL